MDPATIAVSAGRPEPQPDAPLNAPVEFASALAAGGQIEYTRADARNSSALENVLGALEGGRAVLFSSGLAAVDAVLDIYQPKSVVRPPVIYSGTRAAFELRGLDQTICTRWPGPQADLRWLESPTNPDLRVIDLRAAMSGDGPSVVDNTFATPLAQRPLGLGADVVVHSVSKYLSGHSDVILGAVVCADDDLAEQFRRHREITGAVAGPMEAWLALRGLRTLDVRYRRASQNASILAARLAEHPAVSQVIWPGLPDHPEHELALATLAIMPPVIALVPHGGQPAADAVAERVRVWTHATSLGGVESTLERRRRHTAESSEVDPAMLRLSVGIEHPDDLWHDLSAALDAAVEKPREG